MALTKELLRVLDDDSEPLPKRLKIADNAFKTLKLTIQNREAVLLNWIGTVAKSDEYSVWVLFLNWLTSQQTQELSRNDVTMNDLKTLMSVIQDGMIISIQENKSIILKCATAIIRNRTFQLFFKHDVCNYCIFVSQIINQIEDEHALSKFISDEQLFNRYLIASNDFPKYFIRYVLVSFGSILEKFPARKELFLELSAVVEKCLFHRNFKIFSSYFKILYEGEALDENTSKLPKLLLKSLLDIVNNTTSLCLNIYKLIFYSFCASYNNNFALIYKFFILLNETLGFDMSDYFSIKKIEKFNNSHCHVVKSIDLLTRLCQVLSEFKIELIYKVNNISFTEFLKNITLSVMSLICQPNEVVYKFLNCIIVIDPLITEQILNDLLIYVMLSNKESTHGAYEEFLITIFEVFVKLHRIPNLISKMIPTLKSGLDSNFQPTPSIIKFCGLGEQHAPSHNFEDIMSNKVLDYFFQCIKAFASWQVINLFKTLLFHFESAVGDLSVTCEDSSKFVYVEIISSLFGHFLCSARIAEHTTAAGAVEKFVKGMEDLRRILKTFGTSLVTMEHNPTLMRSYLNICHAWGELYVTLTYYSTENEILLPKTLDTDSSACNITYVHSYLTKEQWRLISQRITNFGEKPCKQIMCKLYVQKLKAMMLFEHAITEEVLTAIKSSILASVDDNWRDLIRDQIVLSQIISNTNCKPIAEHLFHDITKTKNFNQLSVVYDNYDLMCMMLYVCISKTTKLFKRRYKNNQTDIKKLLTSKILLHMPEDLFFNSDVNSLIAIRDVFIKGVSEPYEEMKGSFYDTELACYMEIIRSIPVIQYDNPIIQEVIILFLICVFLDLRRNPVEHTHLLSQCENIVIGIAQNCSGSLKVLIEHSTTLKMIITNFKRYSDLLDHVMHNIFKSEDTYASLNEGIKFLIKNIKQEENLQSLILIIKYINKYRKSKISIENKELLLEYQETIFMGLLQLIQRNKKQPDLTEAYALILKHKLAKQTDDEFTELLPFLDKYVDGIFKTKTNTKGSLLLFTTILRNKSKIKVTISDLSFKAWNYCQHVEDKGSEEFTELVILIVEHIPNEQFSNIADTLLENASEAIKENNLQKFIDELCMWNTILSSNLNPIKTHKWQNQLELLLLQHVLPYLSAEDQSKKAAFCEPIVKFEINIIQRAQLPLTALLIDAMFLTISIITTNQMHQFQNVFTSSVTLLQMLLKFRKSQMMDYLPIYLQRYRTLLNMLCIKSNADLKFEMGEEQQFSDCAHKLEKLTNNLVSCNKHLMRIAPYIIADILKQYEEIILLPNVKLHLNNCLYSLMSLCDEHAVSYLMRILSTASTEMFKVTYENYKKYYKFTGRV